MIKFSKVNFGISFVQALDYKYKFFEQEDDLYKFLNNSIEKSLYFESGKKRINIEFVGKEKAIKKFSDIGHMTSVNN